MLSVVNNLSILLKSDVSGRISLLVNAQVLEKCVHLPMSQYDNETTYGVSADYRKTAVSDS